MSFILFLLTIHRDRSLSLELQLIYRHTVNTFIGHSLKMMRHERDHSLVGRSKDFSVPGANHRRPSRRNRNKFGADYTLRVTVHVGGRRQARVPTRKSPRSLLTHSCC